MNKFVLMFIFGMLLSVSVVFAITAEYNFSTTTTNKAYYYSGTNNAGYNANARLDAEFVSYTNTTANDGVFYLTKKTGSAAAQVMVQHNINFTLSQSSATISNMFFTFSGKYSSTCMSGESKGLDLMIDGGHESIGTITTSDADYTKNITSNFTKYLDDYNGFFMRLYDECGAGATSGQVNVFTDYAKLLVTYDNPSTVTNYFVNMSSITAGQSIRINITAADTEGIGGVFAEIKTPDNVLINKTFLNYTTAKTTWYYDWTNTSQVGTYNVTQVWINDTYYLTKAALTLGWTVTSANSCTYSGSGNWLVAASDNCTLSTNLNIYPNNFTLSGSIGFFRILNANFTYARRYLGCSACKYILEGLTREIRLI
jgi:nitrogen fixation protein FixH